MPFLMTREQQRLGAKRAGMKKKVRGGETKNLLAEMRKRQEQTPQSEIGLAHKSCMCYYAIHNRKRRFMVNTMCKTHSILERENPHFYQHPEKNGTQAKRRQTKNGD